MIFMHSLKLLQIYEISSKLLICKFRYKISNKDLTSGFLKTQDGRYTHKCNMNKLK